MVLLGFEELVEFLNRNLLVLELDLSLESGRQLGLNGAVYKAVNGFALLEHFL